MKETKSIQPETSPLIGTDSAMGLHPLFTGLECCPIQVQLNNESTEMIVVIRSKHPIEHHLVKSRHGTYPLDPHAEIQLVEILSDAA